MGEKITIESIKKLALGTTFTFVDDDYEVDDEVKNCLIAAIDPEIGYTIKDINDDNPKAYIFCLDVTATGESRSDTSDGLIVTELALILDLKRVKGVVKWSDFVRCSDDWEKPGSGACPF